MLRIWLALTFCAGIAMAAGPAYSADGVVNASNYTPGPFAANSVVSIFGANLARSTHALAADDISGGRLPDEMNFVRVYVENQPVPMLFVSEGQVNFVMPVLKAGKAHIRVVTESQSGQELTVDIVPCAPALFSMEGGWAIATSATGQLLTPDAPAKPGDTIVVYLTGLGQTSNRLPAGTIQPLADQILTLASLKVTLGGAPIDAAHLKYAGVTPGSAGLYQINLVVPDGVGTDPEIQVTGTTTTGGLKLPIR
jgi:uncharacterized protein (TIGR03437 family)